MYALASGTGYITIVIKRHIDLIVAEQDPGVA